MDERRQIERRRRERRILDRRTYDADIEHDDRRIMERRLFKRRKHDRRHNVRRDRATGKSDAHDRIFVMAPEYLVEWFDSMADAKKLSRAELILEAMEAYRKAH